jgi:hypothetical protein
VKARDQIEAVLGLIAGKLRVGILMSLLRASLRGLYVADVEIESSRFARVA